MEKRSFSPSINGCATCHSSEDCSSVNIPPNCATCVSQEDCLGRMDKPLDKQVGGNHYQGFKIQPKEFFLANNLPFFESSVIKYVCRYKKKDGKKDLLKAIHCCEILIKEYYE